MNVVEASIKRSDHVRSLDHLYPGIHACMHVLDGGALIHRVKWKKKVTYKYITM